jgi:hypothetical protein
MVDYDPYSDPRYIPEEAEIPEQERSMLEEAADVAKRNIDRFDSVILMFQHPGWAVLEEGFERLVEELDVQLQKEKEPGAWKFYRGQLAQVQWFQGLPEDMANRQRRLRRDQAELLRTLGKE